MRNANETRSTGKFFTAIVIALITAALFALPAYATDGAGTTNAQGALSAAALNKASTTGAPATGDFTVKGNPKDYRFDEAAGTLTITGDVTLSTTGTTTQHVVIAADATVTLAGVNIAPTGAVAAVTVNPDARATLVLAEGSRNNVTGGTGHAGIQVSWENETRFASLAIEGEGTLNATGGTGSGGAGIGGSYAEMGMYGNIAVVSGTVVAMGTNRSAGIGSSNNPTNYGLVEEARGAITIDGGNVSAYGVGNGAGIGGGNHMCSGDIVINGGFVYAEGDSGIGSGLGSSKDADKGPGRFFANVTINGGNVEAYATDNMGAGIGGGMYCDAYVTINGGTVQASVNTDGKAYQGGAGIGGGYQGIAIVTINGGDVLATGGNGCPGIGNGALAAITTSSNYSGTDGWTGVKNVRTGKPHIALTDSQVVITGGTVVANGGYAAAGIGSGNCSEWCNVIISGGDVTALGYASDEQALEGGAGIGSGASWVSSKAGYMKETTENIAITGGSVVAIGGWGAAGIGSGAKNDMADSISIDAESACVQAYADGTKLAIDTPFDAAGGNVSVAGNLLQGTFVHAYTDDEGNAQGTEGLSSIILENEATGEAKTLTLMPEGYRSYGTDVAAPGVYTIYTDSAAIGSTADGNAHGAHFSMYPADEWAGDGSGGKTVQYGVATGSLSNYLYLFPVKTIVVAKRLAVDGSEGTEASDLLAGMNGTFHFAIRSIDADGVKGAFRTTDDGALWIESIDIVNGMPQGNAYFANMNDGAFEIWEVDGNGEPLQAPREFGDIVLKSISTATSDGENNNVELSGGVWSDTVTVINTFSPKPGEQAGPVKPADPGSPDNPIDHDDPESTEDPEDDPVGSEEPVAPLAPSVPTVPGNDPVEPVKPSEPADPKNDPADSEEPTTPASPSAPANPVESEDTEVPAGAEKPANPESPADPQTPATNSDDPEDPADNEKNDEPWNSDGDESAPGAGNGTDAPPTPAVTPTSQSVDPQAPGTADPGATAESGPSAEPAAPATPADAPADPAAPATPTDAPAEPAAPATPAANEQVSDNETPLSPDAPSTPASPAASATPTAAVPSAPAAPTAQSASSQPATPTAATSTPTAPVALQAESIDDGATPQAEAIDDGGNPLAGHGHDAECWVHWWIMLFMLATAIYSACVIVRRSNNSRKLNDIDKDVMGTDDAAKTPITAPAFSRMPQPAMSATQKA